jgi:hypothetical protein
VSTNSDKCMEMIAAHDARVRALRAAERKLARKVAQLRRLSDSVEVLRRRVARATKEILMSDEERAARDERRKRAALAAHQTRKSKQRDGVRRIITDPD